jgi:hypothetical protein
VLVSSLLATAFPSHIRAGVDHIPVLSRPAFTRVTACQDVRPPCSGFCQLPDRTIICLGEVFTPRVTYAVGTHNQTGRLC